MATTRLFAVHKTKGNHAFIVCTHIDKSHIHNHIIFNSTNLNSTKKFRDFKKTGSDYFGLAKLNARASKVFSQYYATKKPMQEILLAKKNIDIFLQQDQQKTKNKSRKKSL